jgi:hypothetical protein
VILAILLANKTVLPQNGMPTDPTVLANYLRVSRFASYAMLWSGLGVGLTNLGSGICESAHATRSSASASERGGRDVLLPRAATAAAPARADTR